MREVNYRWVGGHNGHWEFYSGSVFLESCDDNEFTETYNRLKEE